MYSDKNAHVTKHQVSENQSPDSAFAVEAKIKSLCPESIRDSILKSQNCVYTKHEYQPSSYLPQEVFTLNIINRDVAFLCVFWDRSCF